MTSPSGHPYAGRRAALATMHGKQAAIAPPLAARPGLLLAVPEGIDTDSLGTFTGEVPRAGSMQEAALRKARLGMAAAGLDLGLASEGSFGPHPSIPFFPAGIEILLLVDDARGLVVGEHLVDAETNYGHAVAAGLEELEDFLPRAQFPAHALIARPNRPADGAPPPLFKGLRDTAALAEAVDLCRRASEDGRVFVQTDMRAHMNPTRMAAIACLAEKLAARLACLCPACRTPGFGVTDAKTGLPCAACGAPSVLLHYEVLGCAACDHVERRPRADGLTEADPGHCPQCNP